MLVIIPVIGAFGLIQTYTLLHTWQQNR